LHTTRRSPGKSGLGDLGYVAVVEQRELQRPAVGGEILDRRRAAR